VYSEPDTDFASFMRESIGARVVNLGMSSHGPLLELATFAEYGLQLRPRAVLWF
jgi:hypothetical protein